MRRDFGTGALATEVAVGPGAAEVAAWPWAAEVTAGARGCGSDCWARAEEVAAGPWAVWRDLVRQTLPLPYQTNFTSSIVRQIAVSRTEPRLAVAVEFRAAVAVEPRLAVAVEFREGEALASGCGQEHKATISHSTV